MAEMYRNRVHHDDDTIEETKFPKEEKENAKKDHAEKKLKLKKDEKATSHLCAHDPTAPSPASGWWHCRDDPRAEYDEFTKKDETVAPLPGEPEGGTHHGSRG
jgi:hypothetical protein